MGTQRNVHAIHQLVHPIKSAPRGETKSINSQANFDNRCDIENDLSSRKNEYFSNKPNKGLSLEIQFKTIHQLVHPIKSAPRGETKSSNTWQTSTIDGENSSLCAKPFQQTNSSAPRAKKRNLFEV
ncbi:hypothetical protein CEXT_639941 [Caerostris extrusa]|uniref:Uncharacterized protein n=1 Tax=Caerostris extrusa TaxID=172846 RepID=A0AAV4XMG0_CAEEX|nr:hypothetical protein CEXT_639941 [Caerostris extrusa]